jgi:hypothetical protein
MLHLGPMIHTGTWKWAFLNKRAQSHLKQARVLVAETWKLLIPFCHVSWPDDGLQMGLKHVEAW